MKVRKLKEQYQILDEILSEKLADLVGPLMQECNIDLWLIPSKEYNEDPLFEKLTPSGFPTARRLTILALHQDQGKLSTYSVSMRDHSLDEFYKPVWEKEKESQFQALTRLLSQLNPKTIGLNYSSHYAYCDGMTVGILETLKQELPVEWTQRFVSAEALGVRFLETRSPLEEKYWPEVMAVALDIIHSMYNRETITLGKTTCADLEWFMMEQVNQRGLGFWFPPTLDLQRKEGQFSGDTPILEGDLLHCDFGIEYLGLCTDTQRIAYVKRSDESNIPLALVKGMQQNNRFQDIVCENFKNSKSGNDVFIASMAQAKLENIRAMLYTHPLGLHGHAAGPTIGLYSDQNPQPIKGDLLIHDRTGYALELNTIMNIEGYDKPVAFYTEESVFFIDGKVKYLAEGREFIKVI